ncbi:MAG: OmpA family protein [Cytophagia bacterium]|nr:MAG: OmpA family protein [Cytophagia bacterium]TAG37721.1 MAG: OmpA family protein [Cytophagia bacterium]
MYFLKIFATIFLFIYFSSPILFAQKRGKIKQSTDTIKRDDGRILHFGKISLYPYYKDEEKMKAIEKMAKKGDKVKTYHLLYNYVMNFGAKNFQKDLYLVFRLAKLAEELRYEEKAKLFYGIVLKHHPKGNLKNARIFYDSLTRNDKDYYLPIEYYFNYANPSANIDTLDVPSAVYTQMGDSVNSKYDDYGPALGGNDIILLFTSTRNQKKSGAKYIVNEDIFWTRKADSLFLKETELGQKFDTIPWTRAKALLGDINTEYNEGSPCLSKNGKVMYFSRCHAPNSIGNCDIYEARKLKNGKWGKVRNLGFAVNSINWDSQPTLSHTEDTLFFASDRLGGFGMSDIYYTYRRGFRVDADGDTLWNYAKARNVGPIINTRANEVSPFYHPTNNVLYFSSNGQLVNFGGMDIYKIRREVGGKWKGEPKNIGPLVNYKKDEYYFTIDSKARNLYYAKTTKIKFWDGMTGDTLDKEILNLHTATLPMEAQPEAFVKFEGAVTDSLTGKSFEGIVSIIDMDEGVEVAPKYLRPDGSYRFDLIRNRNYLVIITGEDFFRIEKQLLLKGDTTVNFSTPSIKFKKWKFEAIEFGQNSADVTDDMQHDLQKLIFFLADHPNLGLIISGHTEGSNNDENANQVLSEKRAESIRQYLIDKGKFKLERIKAEGHGSKKRVIQKEENEEHKKMNRRVEFEIFKVK